MSDNTDIKNRLEVIFLYDAKDCDPNGDPFTGEPRYDEVNQKVMVSDVRLKRYIRDYIDLNLSDENDDSIKKKDKNKIIFYSSLGETQTVGERRKSIKEYVNTDDTDDLLKKCIDIRLFGCVLAETGKNVNLTGTVQLKNLNRSINKVELKIFQNTSVMKTKEEKTQGAIATSTIVPYALLSTIGYINPQTAEINKTNLSDVKLMIKSLWNQINIMNTRSKTAQTSRLNLLIEYANPFSKISDLETKIKLKKESEDNLDYRSFYEIENDLDFDSFLETLAQNIKIISRILYYYDKTGVYPNIEAFINKLEHINGIAVEEMDFI